MASAGPGTPAGRILELLLGGGDVTTTVDNGSWQSVTGEAHGEVEVETAAEVDTSGGELLKKCGRSMPRYG